MKKTEGRQQELLTPPKLRTPKLECKRDIKRKFTTAPGGLGDIADLSRISEEVDTDLEVYELSEMTSKETEESAKGPPGDHLMGWHPSPGTENSKSGKKVISVAHITPHKKGSSPAQLGHYVPKSVAKSVAESVPKSVPKPVHPKPKGKEATEGKEKKVGAMTAKGEGPRPVSPQRVIGQVLMRIVQSVWWVVEPVFDPDSAIRRRWEQHRAIWQDVRVFLAAAVFTAGAFLITATCARILGWSVHALKSFVGVFRIVMGV